MVSSLRHRRITDDFGCKIEQAWFGLQGEPVMNRDPKFGTARMTWEYDPKDPAPEAKPVRTRRFGVDGKELAAAMPNAKP